MRIIILSWFFLILHLLQIFLALDVIPVSSQCLEAQRSLLLQLKGRLRFNHSLSTKLLYWNESQDCCRWNGVTCDKEGRVLALDLNNESISGAIENSSGLFGLQFLESLNLSANNFNYTQIPSRFNNLTSLRYLNLSNAGFAGQIPTFSNLICLVVLDLSSLNFQGIPPLKLESPDLSMFIQNRSELTELYLDGTIIPAKGGKWCQALSSSVPNLRVLSLRNCNLSGPIDSSLAKLRRLSEIRLSQNNFASPVPKFFVNFKNLTALHFSSCKLNGEFPTKILKISTLQAIDLSYNGMLRGTLPEFPGNGSLQILVLSYTNFSGQLPISIGRLAKLSRIELVNCSFNGPIPSSMENLSYLSYLDLSFNRFTGPIPSFLMSKNLTLIKLSHNKLVGPIPSSHFEGLLNLTSIDLQFNSFNETIPSSLFALPSLQKMFFSNNLFDSLPRGISSQSSFLLDTVDLSRNYLRGSVPNIFFELERLNALSLSFNKFRGSIELDWIQGLTNLSSLDLSYSGLSLHAKGRKYGFSTFPQLKTLKLASCNLTSFPDLKNQSGLRYLDLSDNYIGGQIPSWIWNLSGGGLDYLNLSGNQLVGLQKPYSFTSLRILDLHSNHLKGKIPLPPATATFVDYSNNNFSSEIPADIGLKLTFAYFFSVSSNKLNGTIPDSICNVSYLQVLDFSDNSLGGMIPSCFKNLSETLQVLNLGKNKLIGNIHDQSWCNCNLRTLDLNGNHLDGKVPKFLENCNTLEVLNLGNNHITDTFPCFLKNSVKLRVLILRSNKFHGHLLCDAAEETWPNIQIVDIASNFFSGELSPEFFSNWKGMMDSSDRMKSELIGLKVKFLQLTNLYFQDRVTVTVKGQEVELVKVLTLFTSIDFSNNSFEGVIPETVGALSSLLILNMSRNSLTGPIPSSIGKMNMLESLDLSVNKLNGTIPPELENMTFLSVLNVSYNQLEGKVPTGKQFATFSNDSFEGNKGLCGIQLSRSCSHIQPPTSAPNVQEPVSFSAFKFNWQFICTGLGYGIGAAIVVLPLVLWERGRKWSDKHIDGIHLMIITTVGFIYCCNNGKVEAEENIEEDQEDTDEDEDEVEENAFLSRYCVFCTKFDMNREKAIHDLNCSCHGLTPLSSSSSPPKKNSSST